MFPRHVYRRTVVSVIEQTNNACWSSTKWKSSSSHRNIICSRHNIPKKKKCSFDIKQQPLTHLYA